MVFEEFPKGCLYLDDQLCDLLYLLIVKLRLLHDPFSPRTSIHGDLGGLANDPGVMRPEALVVCLLRAMRQVHLPIIIGHGEEQMYEVKEP